MECEPVHDTWREVPHGQLYLERVEAAGMGALVQAVNDNDKDRAEWVLWLLQQLSIV